MRKLTLSFLFFLTFFNFGCLADNAYYPGKLSVITNNAVYFSERLNGKIIGTGVLLNERYALTCYHVVSTLSSEIIIRKNGQKIPAKLVFDKPELDLAIIELSSPLPYMNRAGKNYNLNVGDRLVAAGAPYGLDGTILYGSVSYPMEIDRDPFTRGLPFLQVQSLAYPGVSGAAVYDMNNRLVGINRAAFGFSTGTGIGFLIPWQVVDLFLKMDGSPFQ